MGRDAACRQSYLAARDDLLQGRRTSEQVALDLVASFHAQEGELPMGLDAFGQYRDVQAVALRRYFMRQP